MSYGKAVLVFALLTLALGALLVVVDVLQLRWSEGRTVREIRKSRRPIKT